MEPVLDEAKYLRIAEERLSAVKITRVKGAVDAVIDTYIEHNQGVTVTSYTRKLLAEAVFGLKADANPRWIGYDASNDNKVLGNMSVLVARLPVLLERVAKSLGRGSNNPNVKITFSDILHELNAVIDSICPIKK